MQAEGVAFMTVLVYLEPQDGRDAAAAGRAWFAPYVCEILAHAGITFDVAGSGELVAGLASHRLLLLPYDAPLDTVARNAVASFARHGAILGIGGPSGLDAIFGVRSTGTLGESYGQVVSDDVITGGVTSSLHCWGGVTVTANNGTRVLLRQREGSAPLLCRTQRAVLIAADLPGTLVHLQQGIPIHQDGAPAPDGSAAIDDGILKTDDGMVLDWVQDRSTVDGQSCFLEPVGDDWRDLLLRSICSLCLEIGEPLPVLWYWPDDVPAVARQARGGGEPDARCRTCDCRSHPSLSYVGRMQDGMPSATARAVALVRATMDRPVTPDGDGRVEATLVAEFPTMRRSPLAPRLGTRTRWFDRVTLDAIDGGSHADRDRRRRLRLPGAPLPLARRALRRARPPGDAVRQAGARPRRGCHRR